jgi:polyketide synthase PksL
MEAHGTATMIGDPIELKALTTVFREHTEERQFCALGSVKTNIGHLPSAAGMASFIKIALALHHKQIPPTLNCEQPNSRFSFETSPFYIAKSPSEWKQRGGIRRAGVSSFGFGGTNCHVIASDIDSHISDYAATRAALPPVVFDKRRFWPDAPARKARRGRRSWISNWSKPPSGNAPANTQRTEALDEHGRESDRA